MALLLPRLPLAGMDEKPLNFPVQARKATLYDSRLITWSELEPWMRDNSYIQTGYRKASSSYLHSLYSLPNIHNETINIWTHLLAAVFFGYSVHNFYTVKLASLYPRAGFADFLAIGAYHVGVVNCFLLSAGYHLFSNHSCDVHRIGNQLDHAGIVLVIWGSMIPGMYFEFYYQPMLRNTYGAALSFCALLSAVFTLRPEFSTAKARKLRFLVYGLLAMAAVVPIVHGMALWSFEELDQRMGLRNILLMTLCQFAGGLVYATRVPERWLPGRFDIVGASHQLMHILVVCGAMFLQSGWLRALKWWLEERQGEVECAIL